MIKISQKNKDKFIGGLIGILLLFLGLWVKSYFYTNKDNQNIILQTPTLNNINKDSGMQTINQSTQSNSNMGDVNNEYISGDKRTYNYSQSKTRKSDSVESQDKQIINNGNLSVGQIGGTINQSTYINPKPEPRHVNQNTKSEIVSLIPSKEYSIVVEYLSYNKECSEFAFEIVNFLQISGYKVNRNPMTSFFDDESDAMVLYNIDEANKIITFTIKKWIL